MSEKEKTENNEENASGNNPDNDLKNEADNISDENIDPEDSQSKQDEEKKQGDDKDTKSDPLADAQKKLEAAQNEAKKEHENYLRLYADFENYKKRSAREIQDFRKFANESLIKELLPVVDNLERAIDSSNSAGEEADKSITQGVDMTLKEILKILEKFQAKPVEAMGKPFDPNFHEAIGQEESEEYEDNIVVKEFQKGYLLHDRLIRPSMVMVSKHKPAAQETPEQTSEQASEDDNKDND